MQVSKWFSLVKHEIGEAKREGSVHE